MQLNYCANGCCNWGMYPQPMVEVEGHTDRTQCPQCGHEERENDPGFKCACEICQRPKPAVPAGS